MEKAKEIPEINFSHYSRRVFGSGAIEDSGYQKSTHWAVDDEVIKCTLCQISFSWKIRRHHCRICGEIFCDDCSATTLVLPGTFLEEVKSRAIFNKNVGSQTQKSLADKLTTLVSSNVPTTPGVFPTFLDAFDEKVRTCAPCFKELEPFSSSYESTSRLLCMSNVRNVDLDYDSPDSTEDIYKYPGGLVTEECFAKYLRVVAGDFVLENPRFGSPYKLLGVYGTISIALYSSSKQLSGFIDVPLNVSSDKFHRIVSSSINFSSLCIDPIPSCLRVSVKILSSNTIYGEIYLGKKWPWWRRFLLLCPFILLLSFSSVYACVLVLLFAAFSLFNVDNLSSHHFPDPKIKVSDIEVTFFPAICVNNESVNRDPNLRVLKW